MVRSQGHVVPPRAVHSQHKPRFWQYFKFLLMNFADAAGKKIGEGVLIPVAGRIL